MDHKKLSTRSIDEILSKFHSWVITEVANGDPSENSVRSYMGSARAFLHWCYDQHIDPTKSTERDIKLYRSHLVQSAYRPSTISSRLAGLKHLFNAFLDWGWIEINIAQDIKGRRDLTSRSEKVIAKYIPDRGLFLDLYKLPDVATRAGKRDRALLRLLCYSAVRVGELCSINIEDVFLNERPTLVVRAGKGRKARHIPLSEEDSQIIDE
jgi:integrase/recombinase XerD